MSIFEHESDIDAILFRQVRPHGVLSLRVEAALRAVKRVPFLPPANSDVAYGDAPIVLKRRCEMPFFVLARVLEGLAIQHHERACVISAGAGYSATLISRLCNHVEAFESDSVLFVRLIDATRDNASLSPVSSLSPDLVDVIFMDGGSISVITQAVMDKLAIGGRLAVVQIRPDTVGQKRGIAAIHVPLCQLIIYEMQEVPLYDEAGQKQLKRTLMPIKKIMDIHMPELNTLTRQNESFHF